jgi:TP901 family phage tail tape measure protein
LFSRITKASATEGTLDEDISEAEKSLRSVGVEVRDSADNFRDLTDIMADLGAVWNSLSSVEKSNIGYNIAGTRQLNVLNSLLGAWDDYSAIIGTVDERTGEALENQEIYADSLQGRLGDLEATAQSTWNNVIDSEALKSGVDILNTLLTLIEKLTSAIGIIPTIGAGAGAFAFFKNLD